MKRFFDLMIIFVIFIVCQLSNCNAQTYYGNNGQGKFIIINDSIGVGYFKAGIGVDCWIWDTDTFRLRKSNDTLFVTTLNSKQLLHIYPSSENLTIENVLDLESITLYSYNNVFDSWTIERMGAWSDTIQEKIFIKDVFLRKERLYVMIKECPVASSRFSFYSEKTGRFDIEIDYGSKGTVLKEMPLLVKGRKLIPANDSLQICCWAENGFFLPVMLKKNKPSYYKPLSFFMRENINLPTNSKDQSFIPKKYLKHLKSTRYNIEL